MLSSNITDTEDWHYNIQSHQKPKVMLSRSTPELSLALATPSEINMKELQAEKVAILERLQQLKQRKKDLQSKLDEKLIALRDLCIAEAEITGELALDCPKIPGKPEPQVKKRIGTEFEIPLKFFENNAINTHDAIERLELEIEIQHQKVMASRKLAEDKLLANSVRKKHQQDYYRENVKLKQLEETLNIYKTERPGSRIAYSKTTDDVDYSLSRRKRGGVRGECSTVSELGYKTLPLKPKHHLQHNAHKQLNYSKTTPPFKTFNSSSVLQSRDSSSSSICQSDSSTISDYPKEYSTQTSSYVLSADWQPNMSDVLTHGNIPTTSRCSYLAHSVPPSHQLRKGFSTPPSTGESSDVASSCSSSLSSLHISNNHTADQDSGLSFCSNQDPNASIYDITSDPKEYSSYLRNAQKTYYPSASKYGCGSLDRKKMVKKNNLRLIQNHSQNPVELGVHFVQLTELTPSKFGSKRESTVDSQDSPFQFDKSVNNGNKNASDRILYTQFEHLSSESSSGISLELPEVDRLSGVTGCQSTLPNAKRYMHFPVANSNSMQSDSFHLKNGNHCLNSEQVLEVTDMSDYKNEIRKIQEKDLHRLRIMPLSTDNPYDCRYQGKKKKTLGSHSHNSQSKIECNKDAVDALFNHNNRNSHITAYGYNQRRITRQEEYKHLPNYQSTLACSSSLSSLSSLSSGASDSKPLRFIKVEPAAFSSTDCCDKVSSSRNSDGFHIDSCSTVV